MPRLLFEKMGNAVWISHLDLMRVFQRAFRRAGIAIYHSQGYSPRAHVSMALPLPVGTESQCELLDFAFAEGAQLPLESLPAQLNAVLPAGIRVLSAWEGGKKLKELTYLDASLSMYETALSGGTVSEEAQAQEAQIAAMFDAWKDRDPEGFAAVYGKETVISSDDELNAKLFTERDPGMIAAAAEYLEAEGENTVFLAVGAGHMVDPGGIVSGLRELGYTVELVP